MVRDKGKSGEFAWIERIRERFEPLVPSGTEGIGDDCAVIPLGNGESLVVTTDMLVEEIHFKTTEISSLDLGYKSLAVNLSDVAAMGASPVGSFLSVGLPRGIEKNWQDAFLEGYRSLSAELGVPLLGGDTTASEKLVVSVTAIGKAPDKNIKRRGGAKPGDLVCVTGNLGDSAAGLLLLSQNGQVSECENQLIKAHFRPKPYVNEGVWLGGQEAVHAMIDVSDGIASDLVHILEESRLSARVELSRLPLSTSLKEVCAERGWDAEELAVSGGEDYVLLIAIEEDKFDYLNKQYTDRFGEGLTVIGRVGEGSPRIEWHRNGLEVKTNWKGFSHF